MKVDGLTKTTGVGLNSLKLFLESTTLGLLDEPLKSTLGLLDGL